MIYGLVTTMVVPLLLPSASWFAVDLYVSDVTVSPVTVNVTLVVFVLKPVLETEQTPLVLVTQVTVPLAPLVHLPVTVTPATGCS